MICIGERGGKFGHLAKEANVFDAIYTVHAGKWRRYHGESWLKRLLDVKTNYLNLRDAFLVGIGFIQSLKLVRKLKPDVVFLKGGFVGVPVGLAAAACHRPIVTHDSDIIPGLANRLVSRWVTYHATALPAEFYSYPPDNVRYVGVLVSQDHQLVTKEKQAAFKRALDVPSSARLLLITGGSLGSRRLNEVFIKLTPQLLETYKDIHIIHQVGKGNKDMYPPEFASDRLVVLEFLDGLYRYTGAADVVVTRAGANTLAELGVQGKACVVVPNPLLAGGHQLKNAEHLLRQKAVLVVDEESFETGTEALKSAVTTLLDNEQKRAELGKRLYAVTPVDAARKLAVVLLDVAKK